MVHLAHTKPMEYGDYKKDITDVRTAGVINQVKGATNEVILFAQDGEFT